MSREVVVAEVPHNGGHDRARIVTEADPDGLTCQHRIVTSQRMIDRLYERGAISQDHYAAATILRDAWERAGLSLARLAAQPMEMGRGGVPQLIGDTLAWGVYTEAMRAMGQWRLPIRQIVISDMSPHDFGHKFRCAGLTSLMVALDYLVRYSERTGYLAFGKPKPLPRHNPHRLGAIIVNSRLTETERSAKAQKAAAARWAKNNRERA